MSSFKKSIATAGMVVLGGLSLSACATTQYVDEQIAGVNSRISALEVKVQQVDTTAQAAGASAQQANQRIDQLTVRVDSIEQQLAAKRPRN